MSRELLRAILRDDVAGLDSLVAAGADLTEVTELERWTYLHRALLSIAMPPSSDMIRDLIGRGLDVNAIDSYGNSPLHYAARLKRADLCRALLDAGADVDAVNLEGVSPLRELLLSRPHDLASLELLIGAGADVDQRNGAGLSVREFAMATLDGDEDALALFGSR